MLNKKTMKIGSTVFAGMLILMPVTLTGCFGGGGGDSQGGNSENMIQVSQTSYEITRNAVNDMVNSGLKFTVTDMQRRPMSVFAGSSISSSLDTGGSQSSQVSSAATTDIVVQIDVSYTWNVNTYATALSNAGSSMTRAPSTLEDVLQPGSLMYVQGEDADGNLYQSADIIKPEEQKDVNKLAINSQWDYDVLSSPLPETSVTKTGSFLVRVPSTAKNLKLMFVTPMDGQDVTQPDDVVVGNVSVYELPLT